MSKRVAGFLCAIILGATFVAHGESRFQKTLGTMTVEEYCSGCAWAEGKTRYAAEQLCLDLAADVKYFDPYAITLCSHLEVGKWAGRSRACLSLIAERSFDSDDLNRCFNSRDQKACFLELVR